MKEGLTNSAKKLFASLATTKGRRENSLFMAQGTKCVLDTIDYFETIALICTASWADKYLEIASLHEAIVVRPTDLERISTLQTAPEVIAIYRIPEMEKPKCTDRLVLALDGVQDPGNLGTIMRVADWMGVTDIIASTDTVDVWNPKVVQATMGAISRVRVYYTDLGQMLSKQKDAAVYGTFLDGEDIYAADLTPTGIIVMGNEGKGIRREVESSINRRLYIPPYPTGRVTSESLNVAIATAITLAEFRRRIS